MQVRLAAGTVVSLFVFSACGAGSSTQAPSASTPPAATATSVATTTPSQAPSATIDLSSLDACTLLDQPALQELTGTTLEFRAQPMSGVQCFWGVPKPGFPQYVEIEVFSRPTGLAGYTYTPAGTDCASVPVAGVGTEAFGGTCSDPQHKVYLVAWDRGVALRLLVNEPDRPLAPTDLALMVQTVLDEIS